MISKTKKEALQLHFWPGMATQAEFMPKVVVHVLRNREFYITVVSSIKGANTKGNLNNTTENLLKTEFLQHSISEQHSVFLEMLAGTFSNSNVKNLAI